MEQLIGRGREAIDLIVDADSFQENVVGSYHLDGDYGPGAVVGTATINGSAATVIANDANAINPRFPVVYFGVIGLEEAYKMACAVYRTIEADQAKGVREKRPIVLIVDTPGNAPGKVEEIVGMNKATGAYQLALAEARKCGHPVIAMVIGRAISGAFLCHGLQADRILALPKSYGTIIHVMPLSSISRITKMDVEHLQSLAQENPVFASGVEFFYLLGGVDEIVKAPDQMAASIIRQIQEVRACKEEGNTQKTGPQHRGVLGQQRGGRVARGKVIALMEEEFGQVASRYLAAP